MSKQKFNQDIPEGWETFTLGFKVAGVHHRQEFADTAMQGNNNPDVFIKPEPDNQYDADAVQVFVNRSQKLLGFIPLNTNFHIGYLPQELARLLVEHKLQFVLKARIDSVYSDDNGRITSVIIHLIGPSTLYSDDIKNDIDVCEY